MFQLKKKMTIMKLSKINWLSYNKKYETNENNHNCNNHTNNNNNENKQKKQYIHLAVEANINGKANAESNEINRNDKGVKNIADSFFTTSIMCIIICII